MGLDFTHDMYLPDRPAKRNRPTPARDRADRPGIQPDPNGTRQEREAWMRSRQAKPRNPLSFERYLSIGEYAIACMYKRLEHQHPRNEREETLYQICRQAVEGYKRK